MSRIKIIADNKIPYLKGVLEPVADVVYMPGREMTPESIRDADALIIRTRTKCNAALLKGSKVKFIASATIGFDHIDTAYCEKAGIRWTNAPGCNSSSVQQYIVSAFLTLCRERGLKPGVITAGVIGVGNVGSKVCRALEAIGVKVLKNDPPRERREGAGEFVDLDHLLNQSDLVTIHVPLNREGADRTWHMADREFFNKMKDSAILFNSSRGEVVDEDALMSAIESDKLSDVVLDVFEHEPAINEGLLEKLFLATPHIAGYSVDGKANGTMMSVRAVSQFFQLGLDKWKPDNLPLPENAGLYLDASEDNLTEALVELFYQTYDIREDDRALRERPGNFEMLREKYPVRREPAIYSVRIFNNDPSIINMLEGIGFSITGDSCF